MRLRVTLFFLSGRFSCLSTTSARSLRSQYFLRDPRAPRSAAVNDGQLRIPISGLDELTPEVASTPPGWEQTTPFPLIALAYCSPFPPVLGSRVNLTAMLRRLHSSPAQRAVAVEPVPTVFPAIEGADIAAVFVGRRIAGDFYDSIRVSSERVLVGLLDVAGRREQTRTLLAAAQLVFRTTGLRLFSPADINESDAMTELCLHINRRLIEAGRGVHSCPAFLACYHEKFGTLCYTNAGHTPALLRDAAGIAELTATGLPLGLFSHATCEAPTVGVAKPGSLLVVSRGVIDSEGRGQGQPETFGLERVKRVFQSSPAGTARSLCESVLEAVAGFSGQSPVSDDRTALALMRRD